MALSVSERFYILRRDDFTCRYCGAKAPDVKLHVDHITPKSQGGIDARWNLVTACAPCNLGKSDLNVTESLIREGFMREGAESRGRGTGRIVCTYCGMPVWYSQSLDIAERPIEDVDSCDSCERLAQNAWSRGFAYGLKRGVEK